MSVYPVGYTLVNGSYDYLSDTGIGATAITQYIPAYPAQMKETTSSEAFEQFQTTNKDKIGNFDVPFIVDIRVGRDQVFVYLNGTQI